MLLYCDCFSGISGDMFLGALIDLGIPAADIVQELNKIPLSFQFQAKKVQKNGIMATQIQVIDSEGSPHDHHLSLHHHHHRSARELVQCMEQSTLSVSVKTKGIEILWKIAEVQRKIHGKQPE
ncbi:MAG: nickel insertion protein, partial [Atribacterota bacterium]